MEIAMRPLRREDSGQSGLQVYLDLLLARPRRKRD